MATPVAVKCSFSAHRMGTKSALVILAHGAEEMEAVITIDVLRRAEVFVTVAGLYGTESVTCSRGVVLVPEISLVDAVERAKPEPFDVVILPGGMKGAESLAESAEVGKLLKEQEAEGRLIAAICAAPIALKSHGIAHGKSITSHPAVKDKLIEGGNYKYSEDRVVHDGNIVTSRGPGTAFEFALKLAELLRGKEKVDEIVPPMLLK